MRDAGLVIEAEDEKAGTPVVGATVAITRSMLTPRILTTDAAGEVSIPDAVAGRYSVHVTHPSYITVTRGIDFDPAKPRHHFAMYRRAAGIDHDFTASGAVMFQAETGLGLIPGATVTWTGPNTVVDITDSLGAYSVGLLPGTYRVSVVPPSGSGYRNRTVDGIVVDADLRRNFILRRESDSATTSPRVQVNVTDERSGRPIAGAIVSLQMAGSGGATSATGVTTRSGQVTLDLRTPGNYLANVSASGYAPMRRELTATEGRITVANVAMRRSSEPIVPGGPGLMAVQGWVVAPKHKSLRPTITDRIVPRTLRAAGEPDWTQVQPVAGADVLWYWPSTTGGPDGRVLPGAVQMLRTDSRGRFGIDNVAENNYRVLVRAGGYRDLDTRVSVRSGMNDPVLKLTPTGSITPPPPIQPPSTGKSLVKLAVLQKGAIVRTIPNAKIMVKGTADSASGVSDRSGRFIMQLAPGRYTIYASHPNYQSNTMEMTVGSSPLNKQIFLTTRSTIRPGTETPSQNSSLTVRVVDQNKRGVTNATVMVMRGNQSISSGQTDRQGFYRTTVPRGAYFLKASGSTIHPGGAQVNVQNDPANATIRVTRTASSSGSSQIVPGQASIQYLAQYRAPGSKTWTTIGSYSTRKSAEAAIKRGKIPLKSETRVVPQGQPIQRRGIQLPQRMVPSGASRLK